MYHAWRRGPFLDQKIGSSPPRFPMQHGSRRAAKSICVKSRDAGWGNVCLAEPNVVSVSCPPLARWKVENRGGRKLRESALANDGWIRSDSVLGTDEASARGIATNHLWYCYVLESAFRQQHRSAEAIL